MSGKLILVNRNHAVFVFFVPRLKELNHSFVRLKSTKKWVLHHPVELNQYDSTFLPCRETPEKVMWCGTSKVLCERVRLANFLPRQQGHKVESPNTRWCG